jgi:effector-binding domain-containing protein
MKRFYLVVTCITLIVLVYYFVFIPYEFQVRFESKTLPGDIIQTIRIWNRSLPTPGAVTVSNDSSLEQILVIKDRTYKYKWNLISVSDSITKVRIEISEPENRILNKLLVPISTQVIESDAKQIVSKFYTILNEHLKITSVSVLGETFLKPAFCVCRTLQTNQTDKANGMMKYYSLLSSFIDQHYLKPEGPPIVSVNEWDHLKGIIKFDFCFSINPSDSIPDSDSVSYKKFQGQRVLKAIYRGNYITSDRAWYALIQYAKVNGYKVVKTPIEYFHDNPNMGLNETNWKAEIYLPLLNN